MHVKYIKDGAVAATEELRFSFLHRHCLLSASGQFLVMMKAFFAVFATTLTAASYVAAQIPDNTPLHIDSLFGQCLLAILLIPGWLAKTRSYTKLHLLQTTALRSLSRTTFRPLSSSSTHLATARRPTLRSSTPPRATKSAKSNIMTSASPLTVSAPVSPPTSSTSTRARTTPRSSGRSACPVRRSRMRITTASPLAKMRSVLM